MVEITITPEAVVFEVKGWDQVWSLRTQLTIPLTHIQNAYIDPEPAMGWFDGLKIAGTGTIDDDGKVGPIGGIEMKTVGARNKGAQYFLTPAENCASAAKDTPGGLTLVKVHTIEDALGALKDIRTGDTADLPKCTTKG